MSYISDPISDMLIRIKNANQRKHRDVNVSHSVIKEKIAEILKKEGYIEEYSIETNKKNYFKSLTIKLKYKNAQKAIVGVKRISKPGLKVYSSLKDLPRVLSGYGIAIISTSQKGLITDKEARRSKIGGEVIAYIW